MCGGVDQIGELGARKKQTHGDANMNFEPQKFFIGLMDFFHPAAGRAVHLYFDEIRSTRELLKSTI